MTTAFVTNPLFQVFVAGKPGAGAKLFTFQAGTIDVPKATFVDFAGLVPQTNPVIFDNVGQAIIRFDGLYYVELFDQFDNLQWTVDNYGAPTADAGAAGTESLTVALSAIGGETEMVATDIYPAGSFPVGGLIFIDTSFGDGQGLNTLTVGTSEVSEGFGRDVSRLAGTKTTPADYTNYDPAPLAVAGSLIVRAQDGAKFDGAGLLFATAFWTTQSAAEEL